MKHVTARPENARKAPRPRPGAGRFHTRKSAVVLCNEWTRPDNDSGRGNYRNACFASSDQHVSLNSFLLGVHVSHTLTKVSSHRQSAWGQSSDRSQLPRANLSQTHERTLLR